MAKQNVVEEDIYSVIDQYVELFSDIENIKTDDFNNDSLGNIWGDLAIGELISSAKEAVENAKAKFKNSFSAVKALLVKALIDIRNTDNSVEILLPNDYSKLSWDDVKNYGLKVSPSQVHKATKEDFERLGFKVNGDTVTLNGGYTYKLSNSRLYKDEEIVCEVDYYYDGENRGSIHDTVTLLAGAYETNMIGETEGYIDVENLTSSCLLIDPHKETGETNPYIIDQVAQCIEAVASNGGYNYVMGFSIGAGGAAMLARDYKNLINTPPICGDTVLGQRLSSKGFNDKGEAKGMTIITIRPKESDNFNEGSTAENGLSGNGVKVLPIVIEGEHPAAREYIRNSLLNKDHFYTVIEDKVGNDYRK